MQRTNLFWKVSAGGNGANSVVQYEDLLDIEEAGATAHPHKSAEEILSDVKQFVVARWDKSAVESADNVSTLQSLRAAQTPSGGPTILCRSQISHATIGLYSRQDTRATLHSKVGNYAALEKSWWRMCLAVARDLGEEWPERKCNETSWSLPK